MPTIENLWLVDFTSEAVADFESVKSRGDRKAVFSALEKLQHLGPRLSSPYVKSLKGEADLFELRPRCGACAVRPIYTRYGRRFVVLAVASDKASFAAALRLARRRLNRRRDLLS